MDILIFAVGLVLIIYVVFSSADDRGRDADGKPLQYDERQVSARGIAFKWGFYTMAACNIVFSVFYGLFTAELGDYVFLMLGASLALGMCVTVGISIWRDAYDFGNGRSPITTILTALLLGIMNLGIVLMELGDGQTFASLLKTAKANNFVVALFCIFLVVIYVAKRIASKHEED